MDENTRSHWENIYAIKKENEVSWFQQYPATSMQFINYCNPGREACIIDVGAGDSHLADLLFDEGYRNIWVLDISKNAIDRAKKRLGEKAESVHWIVSDITEFEPPVKFDCWHDRAAFHFLTTKEKIDKYISVASRSISSNGYMILGTFSESGPLKCSGLEIQQYSEKKLTEKWENNFHKLKCIYEDHITPFNTKQNFLFCCFQKKST